MVLRNDDRFAADPALFGADVPLTPQEQFVKKVYQAVDAATADRLARLERDEGIVPVCKRGCCHCCRYHIVTNVAEAYTLAQYIKREFTTDQIEDVRQRTLQWYTWDNSRPGRFPLPPSARPIDLLRHDPYCPLLVDGACSVYPVRPVPCRSHFVRSQPVFCRAASDPNATQPAPEVLTSVVAAGEEPARALRRLIEHAGLDFSRTQTLLPHALALHMGWSFAQVL